MDCAKALGLRVHVYAETSIKDRTFYLLCLWFGFHAKDSGESLNDLESGNDVMGLMSLLRLD